MVSGCRVWSGGLLGVLLVAAGAALETYDELPGVDAVTYQDYNDIDTGPRAADKRLSPSFAKDVTLYRILKALQLQESRHYKSPTSPDNVDTEQHKPEEVHFKDAVHKRFYNSYYNANGAYRTPELALRPHKKWKIKKGKAIGSQMVCYFKLCAFRSPA